MKKLYFLPVFEQLLFSLYFRGPQLGGTWAALARGLLKGMTIAIGPKNEASTLKSLKLAKIKDFTKWCLFGTP